MEKIKIAIATPGRFNPMGTFSKNYVEYLPFEKILLFGGFVPFFYAGTSRRHQKLLRYFYTFLALKNQKKIDALIKKRFKKILLKEKIDCVLAEFMNTGAAVREACEELEIPLVSNVLGYEINQTEIVEKNTDLYQKLARYKSVVVPVSKKMVETLRTVGFKDERIIWSPLGARKEFFNITPDYNSKIFVAVGRFTAMKSPQNTVRAFAEVLRRFPDAKLIFAGEGELLEETKHLASTLNIAASIDFCGWISQDEQIEISKKVQFSCSILLPQKQGTPKVHLLQL